MPFDIGRFGMIHAYGLFYCRAVQYLAYRSPKHAGTLKDELARKLVPTGHRLFDVWIGGHRDSEGGYEYHLTLSELSVSIYTWPEYRSVQLLFNADSKNELSATELVQGMQRQAYGCFEAGCFEHYWSMPMAIQDPVVRRTE